MIKNYLFKAYMFASLLSIAGTIGFIILSCYWQWYSYHIVDVGVPIKIITLNIKSGDSLRYEVDYCKYMNLSSKVTRTLIGKEENVYLSSGETNAPLGCSKKERSISIPESVAKGSYLLKICNSYQPNPVRVITYCWESETFLVQ